MRVFRGITLVEVLVVVAILGVLIGALTWGFGNARRVGLLAQAASHGAEVSMAISTFMTRNIDLNLDNWTSKWPKGNTSGGPASVRGLSGFDCRTGATLSRSGIELGQQSWESAPAQIGCLIERVNRRFLVHTWAANLDRHYINGQVQ